jgi:Ni/Co efflux regulator RcnB
MRGPGPGDFGRDRRDFAPRGGERRDFSQWHRNFSAPQRFHVGFYRRPAGWYSHRWVFGEILPSLFWAPEFWLADYYDFGLMPPPPGTVWVRDGDDALLIDRYSGEIIQVAYGVFY